MHLSHISAALQIGCWRGSGWLLPDRRAAVASPPLRPLSLVPPTPSWHICVRVRRMWRLVMDPLLSHTCVAGNALQRADRTSAKHEQAPAELAGQAILSIVLCAVYGGSVRAEPRCHHGRLARAVEVLRPLRALVRLALAGDVAPAHQAGCNMNAFARSCGTRRCSRTGKTQQGGRARAENGRPHLMKGSSRPVAFHAMARSKSVARNKDSKIAYCRLHET